MLLPWETKRLTLRAFQDRDLQSFMEYRSAPVVAKYQSWDAPYSKSKALLFIKEMKSAEPPLEGEWYQIAIESKKLKHLIGDCGFCLLAEDPQQAEIGFTLAQPHQGYGYAIEAVTRLLSYLFEDLNLHRVRANCHTENYASARLLERLGMRREAQFIKSSWFKGEWIDEYWYGILKYEWLLKR